MLFAPSSALRVFVNVWAGVPGARSKLSGSVWISMKRVCRDVRTAKKQPIEGPVCLVRATDGKKKISCAVLAKDSIRFQLGLMDVVRAHTGALKAKPKKTRAKAAKAT